MNQMLTTPEIPAHLAYGTRFIDARGTILWTELRAACPTAARAAQLLSDEDRGAWDHSTPDEINAILFEADIDPAAIAALRADVIAVASRARRNACYREKHRRGRNR